MAITVEQLKVVLEAEIGPYNRKLEQANADTQRQLGMMEAKFRSLATKAGIAGNGLSVMTAGMSGVGKSALAAQIANERLLLGMSGLSRSAGVAGKSTAGLAAELKNTSAAGLGLGAVFGTLGSYLAAGQVIEYANAYTRVNRALTAGKQIFGVTLKSQQELTDLANEARIDVDAYAKTYIRTEAAIRDYGFAAGTGATVTSTLAKALKLGSASASEQASTILQFSQALQKGKLDGDEFRTVMENAGVVQELLATRLGVTKGEILKLAADGKLGIRDLVGAMVDGGASIDRIFKQMPTTVDEAFTVLRNNTITYIGKLNEATGATDGLVNITAILARNIETAGDAALVVAASLLAMFTPGIIASVGTFTLAMAAAAGPIGLVIGALGGAATAVALFGNEIKVTEDKTVSLIDRLKAMAQVLRENATALNGHEGGLKYPRGAPVPRTIKELAPKVDTTEREIAIGRGFAAGTSTEFGDGQLKKGNASPSSSDANARLTAYQKETAEVIKRTNALMAQAATIGETAYATERAKTYRDLLTAAEETAKRTGIAITPAQLADMDQASRKYAEIAAKVQYLNAVQEVREGTKAIQDEVVLMGLYGKELETARIEQQLLNAAIKAGEVVTPERRAQIKATAELRAETVAYRDALREVQDASKEMLSSFVSDMRQGVSATEALGNALNKLADRLINAGLDQLVTSLVGGAGNALFGAPATTSGWGATVSMFADGGIAQNGRPVPLKKFANGGISNTAAIFGEAGPEAAIPLKGGKVPVDLRMPTIPKAVAASGGPQTVQVNVATTFNVENGSADGIAQMKREIEPMITGVAQKAVAEMFDRNPRFRRSKI